MSFYSKIVERPRMFETCTGMRVSDFEALMTQLRPLYNEREMQRKTRTVVGDRERERSPGAGSPFANSLEDRVLMVLIYTRLYLSYDFMCLFFKAGHRSLICRSVNSLKGLVEQCLPTPVKVREKLLSAAKKEGERRGKRISGVEEFQAAYPELTALIDGVEQEKQRPKDKALRKSQYSGKKKRHTLKQVVTTTPTGLILEQSPVSDGSRHDMHIFKTNPPTVLATEGVRWVVYGDSGFQGAQGGGIEYRLIERAVRGKPLSPEQKARNKQRSRKRMPVEHTFARRKEYKIACHKYRNKDQNYEQDMNIVAGLVNLKAANRLGIIL